MTSFELNRNDINVEIVSRKNLSTIELLKEAAKAIAMEVIKRESHTGGNNDGNVHNNVLQINTQSNGQHTV